MSQRLFLSLFLSLFAMVSLSSCGGGSSGTGGTGTESFEVRGIVLNDEQELVVGAEVTLEETGEMTFSDSNGEYLLKSSFPGKRARLRIEFEDFADTVTLNNLERQRRARVDLRLDRMKGKATIDSITITPLEDDVVSSETNLFTGVVSRRGIPIGGVLVTIGDVRSLTEIDGSFALVSDASGEVEVNIVLGARRALRLTLNDIPNNGVEVELAIVLRPRKPNSEREEIDQFSFQFKERRGKEKSS